MVKMMISSMTSQILLCLGLLLHPTGVVPGSATELQMPDGKCHGEDGLCLLSLRSMTKRALVKDALDASMDVDSEQGEEALLKEQAEQKQRASYKKALQTHTAQVQALKSWLEEQGQLNTKADKSSDDFTTFLALAKSGQGACHARLLHAKRALDGLKARTHELTKMITAGEQDLAAETESLRVATMNLETLRAQKDEALKTCDANQAEAETLYTKYGEELHELQAMSATPPVGLRDVVIDMAGHSPHWSPAPRGTQAYCAGEQLACGKVVVEDGQVESEDMHGCQQYNPLECRHACEVTSECGGYTVYEHPDAPYKCVLFASCTQTMPSQYDAARGTVKAFEKGPPCDESLPLKGDSNLVNTAAYRGCHDQTAEHKTCMKWADHWTYEYYTDAAIEEYGLGHGSNYCRDPNGYGTLWCYTGTENDYSYYTCGDPFNNWDAPHQVPLTTPTAAPTPAPTVATAAPTQAVPQKQAQAIPVTEVKAEPEVKVTAAPQKQEPVVTATNVTAATAPVAMEQPTGGFLQLNSENEKILVLDNDRSCKAFLDYQRKLAGKAKGVSAEISLIELRGAASRESPVVTAAPVAPVATVAPVVTAPPVVTEQIAAQAALPYTRVHADLLGTAVCDESERIKFTCGDCGPNWGDLQKCKQECDMRGDCGYIVVFDDQSCRGYKKCDATVNEKGASTQIYKRPELVKDACGCYPGTGWSAKEEQCLPNEDTCDDEKRCCSAAMLPKVDLSDHPICVAVKCVELTTAETCNVKVGCGWDSAAVPPCETKATCCSYFKLAGKRVLESHAVSEKFKDLENAMAACDARSACSGVQQDADGTVFAMQSNRDGLDPTMYATEDVAGGGEGIDFFPKGHCRRNFEGNCAAIRESEGFQAPEDPNICKKQQAQLQSAYTLAIESASQNRDDAKDAMSHETLELCREQETNNFRTPLSQLSSAVSENVEVCEKASKTLENLSPVLVSLQDDLDKLEREGGTITTLEAECKLEGAASEYLTDLRNAIMSLENCPGNMGIDTGVRTTAGEQTVSA